MAAPVPEIMDGNTLDGSTAAIFIIGSMFSWRR
jgi:hypothetical protein